MDLIVCYDATASPTRAIQRMGRTGRHREGRVVYILAAGREAEKYNSIEEVSQSQSQSQGEEGLVHPWWARLPSVTAAGYRDCSFDSWLAWPWLF